MSNTSIYAMVTDKIITQLNQGIIPWKKSWFTLENRAINYKTRKPYSLLNQMLLGKSGEYLTFKQVVELGGKIKKGSKSEFVVFWKMLTVNDENNKNETKTKTKTIPLLRYYNVFHISDCEGINSMIKQPKLNNTIESIDIAEKIINNYINNEESLVYIERLSNEAYYNPIIDTIVVPEKQQFKKIEEFYSTLFHEMIHSTMKSTRCNREKDRIGQDVRFGGKEYSKEELIAEIGACDLLSIVNIDTEDTFNNSVAYLQNWIKVLQNDVKFIVSASSKAEKAVKYILNDDTDDVVEE